MLSGPKSTIRRARALRRTMSLPEVLLWRVLRTKPGGLKFRKQQAVGPYIIDFFCHQASLAIEIDGEAHSRGNQPEIDVSKDEYLARNGYRVLRIAAVEVLSDLDAVVQHIVATAGRGSPLHHPSDGPPPLKGRI